MARRPTTSTADLSSPIAVAAAATAVTDSVADLANRGGSLTPNVVEQIPLSAEMRRASLGILLPTFQTTLTISQTIPAGYTTTIFGTLLIASGVVLTIELGARLLLLPYPSVYTPPEIQISSHAPFLNATIPDSYSAVVNRTLSILSGKSISVLNNARLRIL
jgi:hypothetical protein